MTEEILITGAAGEIGSWLRRSLRQSDRRIRLLDIASQNAPEPDESARVITASITDQDAMTDACEGVDAVIHLGGLSTVGYSWDEYLDVNVNGTHCLLEAARRCGVPRVVYASSHHAVGFQPNTPGRMVPDYLYSRPDSLYGFSKAASESLCSLYHDRYGLDVICIRIGSFRTRPTDLRTLWNWLSPGDCTRLFEAALTTASPGFRLVWGVSANDRGIMSLEEARTIGYVPLDDAEEFISDIGAGAEAGKIHGADLIGGPFTSPTVE
jgi:NAD(P)-dependent dehydrogenase (short-subunit alcohol dehydrogenase family)